MGVDDDADFGKGMEYGASSTDVALQFSWVSVHTDKQTLAIDFILNIVCRCFKKQMTMKLPKG